MAKKRKKRASKKDAVEVDLHQQVDLLLADMNTHYEGRGRVRRASEYILPHLMRRCPSGFPSLDVATAGGLPSGTFVEIVGGPGTGKTELATEYMAKQQEIFGDACALAAAMTEFHFDKMYAKRRGLRIALSDEEIAAMERADGEEYDAEDVAYLKDQVGEFVEAFSPVAEAFWSMVVDFLVARFFKIILVDSLGSLMPMAEAEADMEDKHYAGSAGVNTAFFHKFHAAMGLEADGLPNETLVLGINQMRDNIGGGMFAPDYRIGGGNAKDHGKSACIMLRVGSRIRIEAAGQKGKRQVGKMVRWEILKGKHGFPEGATGELRYLYSIGFDRAYDIVTESILAGLIDKKGSWFSLAVDGANFKAGDKMGQGDTKACEYLRARPEIMEELYQTLLSKAGVRCNVS
jgi:recombination protein RecA